MREENCVCGHPIEKHSYAMGIGYCECALCLCKLFERPIRKTGTENTTLTPQELREGQISTGHAVIIRRCSKHGYYVRYLNSMTERCAKPDCQQIGPLVMSVDPASFFRSLLNADDVERLRLLSEFFPKPEEPCESSETSGR